MKERGPDDARDPLVGSVVADRYEVVELLTVGGMARIYRAVQRSLDRTVVVKVIDPALMTADDVTADEAVARFMVEAQAASRLNHPNVVNVFDFGRTSATDGGQLFLVMEFLAGNDLRVVLGEQPLLPIPRVANILRQVLAALGEAHYLGMAHRDVKPENVILEPRRGGADHVKVIDFGLAKLDALQSVTRAGRTIGTPHYMSPEQVQGITLGSGDLYAVGIMLFEMLTAKLPFDGGSPVEIMVKHLREPRPDPRTVAPDRNIPAALANVCMRAIHADPSERFADADALASAIGRAAGVAEWSSAFDAGPVSARLEGPVMSSRASMPEIKLDVDLGSEPPAADEPTLVGREADVDWVAGALADRARVGLCALWGRPGVGRTRLLHEVTAVAQAAGTVVVLPRVQPAPRCETGYSGLQRMIGGLVGLPLADPVLASGRAAVEPEAAAGLRLVFSGDLSGAGACAAEVRRSAADALAWAARQAIRGARGATVLLAVDDVDRLDGASLSALRDLVAAQRIERFVVVTTSSSPLEGLPADRTRQRQVTGVSVALGADVEPLLIDLARRWRVDLENARPRPTLSGVVQRRIQSLAMVQRRLLQSVAITGGGTFGELSAVESRRGDLDRAMEPLADAGFLVVDADEGIFLAHEVLGRTMLEMTPAGVLAELHARAADALAGRPELVELRAHHAVRGQPGFEAFMLVEEAASLRVARGDDEGALAILSEGVRAGRLLWMHGEAEAGESACVVFARGIAAVQAKLGRDEEASAVLQGVERSPTKPR